MYMYVRTLIPKPSMRALGLLVLIAGIVGALSRAPWLGAGLIIVIFILLGPSPMASLSKIGLGLVAALPVLLGTAFGQEIIDHLPWIGTVDARNVDGREHLMEVAMRVIMDNPWFGRFDFYVVPAIQELRGNDGIIDLVNTYVILALQGGFVTVALFAGTMLAALGGLAVALLKMRDRTDERHVLGRALVATLIAAMFIIATVSPIFFVFPLLWSLTGMCVACTRLIEQGAPATQPHVPTATITPPLRHSHRSNAPPP
jgi:O-antigen ligase